MKKIKTYLSRPKGLRFGNFGDELTIPILERLFGIRAIPVPVHKAELIATGSLLDAHSRATLKRKFANVVLSSGEPLHIWGSGFIFENRKFVWPRPTIIHAVRGHLSKMALPFEGPVGDPGILASRLIDKIPVKDAKVVVVPHFVDHDVVERMDLPRDWKVVHPDGESLDIVSRIASAEVVISSSLHGLIVADSFGIPVIWAQSSNNLLGGSRFKFYDHASARGKPLNEPISYAEIIEMSDSTLLSLMTVSDRNISSWSEELIKSFPFGN